MTNLNALTILQTKAQDNELDSFEIMDEIESEYNNLYQIENEDNKSEVNDKISNNLENKIEGNPKLPEIEV